MTTLFTTTELLSIGRIAQQLQTLPPRIEAIAIELGIRPAERRDGIWYFHQHDIERISELLRRERQPREQA